MGEKRKPIFVIGHKNPDTDSICSAICYAKLKSELTGEEYIPARAGNINEETQYILERFNVKAPIYMEDMGPQVRDIEIRETEGVPGDLSLKKAWNLMREQNIVTLPITNAEQGLEGLITIGDITQSYMENYDNTILAEAKTAYRNILETLDAKLICGDLDRIFEKGKVLIAAADTEALSEYIEEHDLVIAGNRDDVHKCALEKKVDCIIVCRGAEVSEESYKAAVERNCIVMSTPYDTYAVARLMNQSMPISFFMTTDDLDIFNTNDYVDTIKEVMATKRHRDFPIVDKNQKYVGTISRRNLMNSARKRVILVDHNEKDQAVDGIETAEILEIIDHHRLRSVETFSPVFFRNQPLGCTATIIYQMFIENNIEIDALTAGLLCSAILSDTLMYRSPTCTPVDKDACEALAKIAGLDSEELAASMFKAGSNLKDKSVKEIFYQDYKKFSMNDVNFAVAQINSLSREELVDLKGRIVPFMRQELPASGVSMLFFMLTNILKESTELVFVGDGAEELIERAFDTEAVTDEEGTKSFYLRKFVSRKKQMIPQIMVALQK